MDSLTVYTEAAALTLTGHTGAVLSMVDLLRSERRRSPEKDAQLINLL